MEKLAQFNATKEGKDLLTILEPTIDIFRPLLQARSAEILAIPKRTFQYGETSRHQLDIYYPSKRTGEKTPILFFVYGGGWVSGERTLAAPNELAYANVGYYFAQHGFITIIPDYRLVPTVTFPAPAQDVRDAMLWVVDHPAALVFGSVSTPAIDSLFLVSHSAGANLATTVLALPELYSDKLHPRIKGAVLIAGAYRYIAGALPDALFVMHWGSVDESFKKDSVALVSQVEAECDTDGIKEIGKVFLETLAERHGIKVTTASAKGHNHVSVHWALGTGQGEEWAEQVVQFAKKNL
ncbi:alpha/beta hydrolase domain-containing protein [Mycena floridula]|nr:alpha/beta hydrolase domain-containing protein [Mycena floridula]